MSFSSVVFLVFFLPITFSLFLVLARAGVPGKVVVSFIALASLVFYAWAGFVFLLIFLVSIVTNYILARELVDGAPSRRRILLCAGIAFNLGLLGYFKYATFFLDVIGGSSPAHTVVAKFALPVGISFYTFQKIAYLVDVARGEVKPKPLLDYLFFVTFFPQLVAGPIVRHDDIFPQIDRIAWRVRRRRYAAVFLVPGLALLTVGLAKKVLLADSFAFLADPAFTAAAEKPLTLVSSWIGLLAYSFQIYFDFSGYSDIALGLALLFGVRLPANFNSPYRATSIIDFWRRWHMTLSRFLRDYLYVPLGGNRLGTSRRYVNLMITMLIGGLWHGASWNFVIWGGLHGVLLSINHGVRNLRLPDVPRPLAAVIVFLTVSLAWVPFRASDLHITVTYYRSLFGLEGIVLPPFLAPIGALTGLMTSSDLPSFSGLRGALAIAGGLFIVWTLPNSLVLLTAQWRRRLVSSRAAGFLSAGIIVICVALIYGRQSTPFIYFQF